MTQAPDPTMVHYLTPEGVPPSQRVYDCAAHLILCPTHDKIALCRQPSNGMVWFPYTPLAPKLSWNDSALNGAFRVLSGPDPKLFDAIKAIPPFTKAYPMEVLRMQVSLQNKLSYITRLIFYSRIDPNHKNPSFKCCTDSDRITWIPLVFLETVRGFGEPFWGPELFEFTSAIKQMRPPMQKIHEFSLAMAYTILPRDPPGNDMEEMLSTAGVTGNDVARLYSDFIEHCFPSFAMSIYSFKHYMIKYGLVKNENDMIRLFRAFNQHQNGYLNFHELLIGLTAMDPNAKHGQVRLAYVYRFYDKAHNGFLTKKDFFKMVREMHPNDSEDEAKAKATQYATQLNVYSQGDQPALSFGEFRNAVISRILKGTSTLCRIGKPIFMLISHMQTNRMLKQIQANAKNNRLVNVVRPKYQAETCRGCTAPGRKYKLVGYLCKMNRNMQLENPKLLTMKEKLEPILEPFLRPDSAATHLLAEIRAFAAADHGTHQEPKGVMAESQRVLVNLTENIKTQVLRLFSTTESKCVTSSSPCFVIGDIHGNIEDLLTMEYQLWRRLPVGPNVLFLGDYVDRGHWGVECALYVLCLKVLFPHKVMFHL